MKLLKNLLMKKLDNKIVIELYKKFLDNLDNNENYALEKYYMGLVKNITNEFVNFNNPSNSLMLYHHSSHYGNRSFDYCLAINAQGFEFYYFGFTKLGEIPEVKTEINPNLDWQEFLKNELGNTPKEWLDNIEKKYLENGYNFDIYLGDILSSSLTTNQVKDLIGKSNSENTDKELTL